MPDRLTLNLFSPLPPQRSEIANVTVQVALALRELAEVTLWTAQAEPPQLPEGLSVQVFDPAAIPWRRLQLADLNVYNIGNNATFHRTIFDVAQMTPGLVVLHDTRLQHFFARYAEASGADRAFYIACMRRSHGMAGVAEAQAFVAGQIGLDRLVDAYPMTAAALHGALGAVLHNPSERAALAAQTAVPVFDLNLPFSGPGPGPGARTPPDGTLRLIAFGHMGSNRRLGSVLEALAGHGDAAIRLDIYGVLEDAAGVAAQIAASGLAERVTTHGFVPDANLTAALQQADLAVNLRFPSMGEASASQLRIWDAAVPSLVTRTAWYAGLPKDAVFFVEPETEIASIRGHLQALRADPARFRQAGLRGRAVLLAQHTTRAYAEGLVAIARMAPALHARRAGLALSRVAVHGLMEVTDRDGLAAHAEPVAHAIRALTQP